MTELNKIIEKLELSDDVDAVFLTGSHGLKESKPYSDIDLVIILKENKNNLYSLYRWIDGTFADIFFFDLTDLKRIETQAGRYENEMDPVFVRWLKKADIKFDKSNILTSLKQKMVGTEDIVLEKIKKNLWQKINYNYVANKRYYESGDSLYQEALELRLLYSVIEVICGYLGFRNIEWRGEKWAVKYLKENIPDFYKLFQDYISATSLNGRFNAYSQMFDSVFTDKYKKWTEKNEVIIKKDFSVVDSNDFTASYIKSLF
jgi:predicted nucleotidyltransferase